MNIETESFRHGAELLRDWPELHELKSVISGIKAADIVAHQVRLFADAQLYPGRTIDFMKNHLGVEIAFNNESYAERILFRLDVASESEANIPAHVVHGGVIVVASDQVKEWGSMDSTVGTFAGWRRSVELVKSSFSVPLVLLGLLPDSSHPGWSQPSSAFGKKPPTPPTSHPDDDD